MSKSFYDLLNEQIGHEFAASHQYLSMGDFGLMVRTFPSWRVTSTASLWRSAGTPS